MPRILYIWQGDFPWEVRVEKVALALRDGGHEVTVMARCRAGEPPEGRYRGIRVVRVGAGRPRSWSVPLSANPAWRAAIRREVADWRPDLIMPREIMLAGAAAGAAGRHGSPVVIDMAEHYPATMRAFRKYRERPLARLAVFHARLPDRIERRGVARADGIITVCVEQNGRLRREYGYPETRMAVVHNTLPLDAFPETRLGASSPVRVFAYHGSMSAQRGLDNLLRGFAPVAQAHPEIRLDLAGDGESKADLERLASELGLVAQARFVGRYRYEDLGRLYGEADVGLVVYPPDESIEYTIGNKLFDYMLYGKPVIVSPAEPLRRVVRETGAGIVLEDADPTAIARGLEAMLAADPAPYSEAGRAAARARYHWGRDAEVLRQFVGGYL